MWKFLSTFLLFMFGIYMLLGIVFPLTSFYRSTQNDIRILAIGSISCAVSLMVLQLTLVFHYSTRCRSIESRLSKAEKELKELKE